jgi:glycosyltransferase involved in cell wall biosynthesis
MKIGVYVGLSSSEVGGGELSAVLLAEALARENQVEFIHHNRNLTKDLLKKFVYADLGRVCFRYEAFDQRPVFGHSKIPWRRYKESREWSAELSEPYDLFINFTHDIPPFCHAKRGVLIILFPLFNRATVWPWKRGEKELLSLRNHLIRHYYDWEWKKRLDTYQFKFANSLYTRDWTKRWWGIDCDVLYPPIECDVSSRTKKKVILSVGRFTATRRKKNQLEMVRVYAGMSRKTIGVWKYICAGALGQQIEDQEYFELVKCAASGFPITVSANLPRETLERVYGEAGIFWHAAGYDLNEELHPDLQEHFGMSTVEAMAAGCVPIVVNRGGQREIVEHGVSGFLWDSIDDLEKYTLSLMLDDQLRQSMSEAARARAQKFTKNACVDRFRNAVGV